MTFGKKTASHNITKQHIANKLQLTDTQGAYKLGELHR